MKRIILLLFLSQIFLYSQSENLPNNYFDWNKIIIPVFTIIGIIIGWKLNSKSQTKLLQNQTEVNLRKEGITQLQNSVSEYIGMIYEYDLKSMYYFHIIPKQSNDSIPPKIIEQFVMDGSTLDNKMELLLTKISSLIDFNNSAHLELFSKISELRNLVNLDNKDFFSENRSIQYRPNRNFDKATQGIRELLRKIIKEDKEKIIKLKK